MPMLRDCFPCVRMPTRTDIGRRATKIAFGSSTQDAFQRDSIPSQLKDLLVIIAQDGVLQRDLFRRPGNPSDLQTIITKLQRGDRIEWKQYNYFTLANVAKRFLLSMKDGLLGASVEKALVDTLEMEDDQQRIEAMHSILTRQPIHVQRLLALLFGIWFRMIYHTDVNAMSVEAVAKSVAGSVFPSCTTSPQQVELASKVMEHLITGFASPDLFGHELIQYFAQETKTALARTEKFIYECYYAANLSREECEELFSRMMLEECRKHNFDLSQHEVSEEEYENFVPPQCFSPSPAYKSTNECDKNSISPSEVHQTSEIVTRVFLTVTDTMEEDSLSCGSLGMTAESKSNHHNSLPRDLHPKHPTTVTSSSHFSHGHSFGTSTPSHSTPLHQRISPPLPPLVTHSKRSPSPELRSQEYVTSIENATPLQGGTQRFSVVRRRQQAHLEKRSAWFLSSPQGFVTHDNSSNNAHASGTFNGNRHRRSDVVDTCKHDSSGAGETMLHLANTGVSAVPVTSRRSNSFSMSNDYPSMTHSSTMKDNDLSNPPMQLLCVRHFIVERLYAPQPLSTSPSCGVKQRQVVQQTPI